MVYLTADTHFSHTNILRYCQRPFVNTHEMNKTMIDNWNAVVTPEDTVYHLGDFCLGSLNEQCRIFNMLNGKKYLVKGNHDSSATRMVRVGFTVLDNGTIYEGGMELVHNPKNAKTEGVVLHGHIHNSPSLLVPRFINVGVDVRAFAPVSLTTLEQEIAYWK